MVNTASPALPRQPRYWRAGRFELSLAQPLVMGIVNVTPDSFSDGGQHASTQAALAHCEDMAKQGAHILDVGGESSRPGAPALSHEQEWARIGDLLQALVKWNVPISVDTYHPQTMAKALDLGVDIINDIRALTVPGACEVVAGHARCGVCLMHMQGLPQTMQQAPTYDDPLAEVRGFLGTRAQQVMSAGVAPERIVLDPGYGFGKSVEHNLAIFSRQPELQDLKFPLLVGWSNKSTLGAITGRAVEQRQAASLAAALAAVQLGASILRVHDVAPTVDALKIWGAAGLFKNS